MAEKLCPLLTFDPKHPEPCVEHACAFYTQLQGTHPQTGEVLNEWGCAIAWMPMLAVENSQQQRQTGAAVESFRNEMARSNEESRRVFAALTAPKQITREDY